LFVRERIREVHRPCFQSVKQGDAIVLDVKWNGFPPSDGGFDDGSVIRIKRQTLWILNEYMDLVSGHPYQDTNSHRQNLLSELLTTLYGANASIPRRASRHVSLRQVEISLRER
jgi:hypothetical protein